MKILFTKEKLFHFLSFDTIEKKKCLLFISVSLFLSIYLTLLFYPGVLYSDSYVRWKCAKSLLHAAISFDFSTIESWLSITPQFFMSFFYALTANYATYTLIQAFLFFFSTFLIIDTFVTFNKYLTAFIFIIAPMFYAFSIYHEMSVGCVIGLNFGLLFIFRFSDSLHTSKSKLKYIFYFLLLWLCFYICFGFRQNAFTILPVILFAIYYLYKKHNKKLFAFFQVLSVIISLYCVSFIPSVLGITVQDSSSGGFVWEILSTIQIMPAEKQSQYSDYLDFLSEEGSTLAALEINNPDTTINSWRASIFPSATIGEPKNSRKILHKYIDLCKNEFSFFIKNKFHFIDNNLGFTKPIHNYEYDYNRNNELENYGFHDNALRNIAVSSYNSFQKAFPLFRMPYIWFVLGILGIIYAIRILPREKYLLSVFLFLISIFYYGAFLINTQSFEFRYFFPSFYYLFLLIIPLSLEFFKRLIKKILRR